jgi:hypothetical protein
MHAAFLDEVSGDNETLRQEVDALLAGHDRLGQVPAHTPDDTTTDEAVPGEAAGTMIGSY